MSAIAQRYIDYIPSATANIQTYTAEGKAAFLADTRPQEAVLFNLETLCDATAQLPETWRVEHPEVNWQVVKDFRNRLAHQYFNIRLELVWNAIESGILEEILDAIAPLPHRKIPILPPQRHMVSQHNILLRHPQRYQLICHPTSVPSY